MFRLVISGPFYNYIVRKVVICTAPAKESRGKLIRGAGALRCSVIRKGEAICVVRRGVCFPAPPPTSFRYQSAALKQARYLVWRKASSVVSSRGRGLRGRFSTHYCIRSVNMVSSFVWISYAGLI